jgi:hypothetical protein
VKKKEPPSFAEIYRDALTPENIEQSIRESADLLAPDWVDDEWNARLAGTPGLRPLEECLEAERVGQIVADVTLKGGDITQAQVEAIIREVCEQIELPHAVAHARRNKKRVRGVRQSELWELDQDPRNDIVLEAAFWAIEVVLGRRFAPYKKHSDQGDNVYAAHDADAALWEGVCIAVGIERDNYSGILDRVKEQRGRNKGKRRKRARKTT